MMYGLWNKTGLTLVLDSYKIFQVKSISVYFSTNIRITISTCLMSLVNHTPDDNPTSHSLNLCKSTSKTSHNIVYNNATFNENVYGFLMCK